MTIDFDAIEALVAEVERLRVLNTDLRLMVDSLETAAHEERAAVVAWLRNSDDDLVSDYGDDIERGEHRNEVE